MKRENIPTPAVRRLSLYLRQLESFLNDNKMTVSSRDLGLALRLTDAQVRKDLAYFGQFGHPGIGYRVDELIVRVRHILGTDKMCNVCVVGAGNLGTALLAYRGFVKKGFKVVAVFDSDPAKIGQDVPGAGSLRVEDLSRMKERVQQDSIRIGILAVPADAAQEVAQRMIDAGICGILNFAPISLSVPADYPLVGVDLAVHLEQLSFQMTGEDGDKDDL
jgi:redox-sensing transcriptional repressor